jgi:curved DNA-binding protein CbpA
MSLYEILELNTTASEQEIKKAYTSLSKKYHPDKCKDSDASQKFQAINNAYKMLSDDTIRTNYLKMNTLDKSNFQKLLEKLFSNNLNIEELKNIGIRFTNMDWTYLEKNYITLLQSLNFRDIFTMFVSGKVPIKKQNGENCSDSDTDCYNENQADYYYDLPFEYQKINKLDIRIKKNISISDLIEKDKGELKIKRNFEDEDIITKYIYNFKMPYVVFHNGGDMNDGDYGNLIIELNLPKNFYWKENMIIYEHLFTGYQMFYGLDISLTINNKIIKYMNWVPSRDGFIINIESLNIKNHNFIIKLVLNYEHDEEKEQILKYMFN